jgi:hypothetical protein
MKRGTDNISLATLTISLQKIVWQRKGEEKGIFHPEARTAKMISKNTISHVPFSQYKRCRNNDEGVELASSVWINCRRQSQWRANKAPKTHSFSPFYHSVQWFEQGFPYITVHLGSAAIHESSATE